MGDYTNKLAKKAQGTLEPGEQLLAAVRALPAGGIIGQAITVGGAQLGGVATMMAAEKLDRRLTADGTAQAAAAGFPLAKKMVLGLTGTRLTVWNTSLWTGGAKQLIGSVPLGDLAQVAFEKGKVTNSLVFTYNDGSQVSLDTAKLEKTDRFVATFTELKAGAGGAQALSA